MNDALIRFYQGQGQDHRGRTLDEILAAGDVEWERSHDFIQWVFPLPTMSRYNPHAPLLDADTIKVFRSDPTIMGNVTRSFARAEGFFGAYSLEPQPVWFRAGNHNLLRLTRIMEFLMHMGQQPKAYELYQWLVKLTGMYQGVGERSHTFWKTTIDMPVSP